MTYDEMERWEEEQLREELERDSHLAQLETNFRLSHGAEYRLLQDWKELDGVQRSLALETLERDALETARVTEDDSQSQTHQISAHFLQLLEIACETFDSYLTLFSNSSDAVWEALDLLQEKFSDNVLELKIFLEEHKFTEDPRLARYAETWHAEKGGYPSKHNKLARLSGYLRMRGWGKLSVEERGKALVEATASALALVEEKNAGEKLTQHDLCNFLEEHSRPVFYPEFPLSEEEEEIQDEILLGHLLAGEAISKGNHSDPRLTQFLQTFHLKQKEKEQK